MVAGNVSNHQTLPDQPTPNATSGNGEKAAGGVLLGVAAAAVVTGIVLVATSATTWTALRPAAAARGARKAAPSLRAVLGGTLASF